MAFTLSEYYRMGGVRVEWVTFEMYQAQMYGKKPGVHLAVLPNKCLAMLMRTMDRGSDNEITHQKIHGTMHKQVNLI